MRKIGMLSSLGAAAAIVAMSGPIGAPDYLSIGQPNNKPKRYRSRSGKLAKRRDDDRAGKSFRIKGLRP